MAIAIRVLDAPITAESSTGAQAASFMALFHSVPTLVYARDPHFIPSTEGSVEAQLLTPKACGSQRLFVALKRDTAIARAAARLTELRREGEEGPIGVIGFFEACDDAEAISRLLCDAVAWLKEAGAKTILGPMDGDTWHRYRFMVGPYDHPPLLLEPYNPPYYGPRWEQFGFVRHSRYTSKHVEDIRSAHRAFRAPYDRLLAEGFRFRPLDTTRLHDELVLLHQLSLQMFDQNHYFTPIGVADFLGLYVGMERLLSPDYISVLHAPDGAPAGFLFTMPEYRKAVAALKRTPGLTGKLRFFFKSRRPTELNMKTLGVIPEHRRRGIGKALFYHAYEAALRRNIHRANLCLMHADNPSQKLDAGEGRVIREYYLYMLPRE